MTPEVGAIVAELRLFNHHEAADLIERQANAAAAPLWYPAMGTQRIRIYVGPNNFEYETYVAGGAQ